MKIYLSYAIADRPWSEKLASLLRAEGFEINGGERNAPYDEEHEETYRQDFLSADCVVLVFTEHSARQPWVLFELGAAMTSERPVIPLLVIQDGKTPRIPFQATFPLLIRAGSPQDAATQLQQVIPETAVRV